MQNPLIATDSRSIRIRACTVEQYAHIPHRDEATSISITITRISLKIWHTAKEQE